MRVRLRTLLILVAVVALLFGCGFGPGRWLIYRDQYRQRACTHAAAEQLWKGTLPDASYRDRWGAERLEHFRKYPDMPLASMKYPDDNKKYHLPPESFQPFWAPREQWSSRLAAHRAYTDQIRQNLAYDRQMRLKYERASRSPWILVFPDPTPPAPPVDPMLHEAREPAYDPARPDQKQTKKGHHSLWYSITSL
jgi:hypothetical protein